ncbi:hypothetical protein L1887_05263 [Cichorium endivia]|nr:hypothetical protein L1887_05263 [Cichorium endivia]
MTHLPPSSYVSSTSLPKLSSPPLHKSRKIILDSIARSRKSEELDKDGEFGEESMVLPVHRFLPQLMSHYGLPL